MQDFTPLELFLESTRKGFAVMRNFIIAWVADGRGIEPESIDPRMREDGEMLSSFARTADPETINKVLKCLW